MVVRGTYIKNLFFDNAKGQAAFLIKPLDDIPEKYASENGLIKAVGKYCLQQKFMPLYIKGEWRETDYGNEFHIHEIHETHISEEDTESLIAELGVTVSRKEIKKIMKVTGEDIFAVAFMPDVESLVSEKSGVDIITIVEVFAKIKALSRELALFQLLDKYNGTYEHCQKIMKKFPDNAMDVLSENPYRILEDVNVPFRLIDQIALDNGTDPLSDTRIKAILLWAVRNESNSGNVYMTLESICRSVGRTYGDIPASSIIAALEDHPYIVNDPDYPDIYYEKQMLYDEKLAAKEFARLLYTREELPFHPEYIDRIEEETGRKLGNQQRSAFQLLRTTGIKLLTGDPGTGKTTTVNVLLKYLEMVWDETHGEHPRVMFVEEVKPAGGSKVCKPKFALCAPSGRAAQRMKETTQRNALTIHKLLEYQPYGGRETYKDADDPIDADIIVVDEVSMLGLSIFSKLLAAIKNGSLVLLVGDVNQLQSVDPGDVLQDVIRCGYVDSCHLTEVFRQAEESLINTNAKRIINGEEKLIEGNDFSVIQTTPEETENALRGCIATYMEECKDPSMIQALSPVKKGTCGVKAGNAIMQGIFNPGKGGIWYGFKNYKENDRVIMLSNNYALQYYNGDVGYITALSDTSMCIQVGDEKIVLPRELYGDMDLAYSCTVHKSQGSEYEYLIIVLQEEGRMMLDQNLLYTAVTRGKKKVTIIHENDTLNTAIRTRRKGNRRSMLALRIRKEIEG